MVVPDPGRGGGGCSRTGTADALSAGDGTFTMRFHPDDGIGLPPCANTRVRVFIAYYTSGPDGVRTRTGLNTQFLTAGQRSVSLLPVIADCVTWIIGDGDGPIPDTLPPDDSWLTAPGLGSPFWDAVHGRTGVRDFQLAGPCATPEPSPSAAEPTPSATP
jgi:hypothetical protein